MAFITLLCVGSSLVWIGFINLLASSIHKKLNLRVNKIIVSRYASRIFSFFSAYMNFRVRFDVADLALIPDHCLMLSNHQSLLDIPLMMRCFGGERLRFVAKAELGRGVPVVSRVLVSDGHCLIDRKGSASQAMQELDSFAARISASRLNPVLFPEGTRSTDGTLGEFQSAGFRRLQEKYPLPVVACVIDGGWRISSLMELGKATRGAFYRLKVVGVFPPPRGKAEQVRILEESRVKIQEQLDVWRKKKERS